MREDNESGGAVNSIYVCNSVSIRDFVSGLSLNAWAEVRRFLLAVVLACGAMLVYVPILEASETISADSGRAVRRMLDDTGISELMVRSGANEFDAMARNDPALAKDIRWLKEQIIPTVLLDTATQLVAEHLSPSQADELRVSLSRPQEAKAWNALWRQAFSQPGSAGSKLSGDQQREIEEFVSRSEVRKVLKQVLSGVSAKFDARIAELFSEYWRRYFALHGRRVADAMLENARGFSVDSVHQSKPLIAFVESDDAFLAKIMAVVEEGVWRAKTLDRSLLDRAEQLGFADLLIAENLVGTERVEEGLRRLDEYERAASIFYRDMDQLSKESTEAINKMKPSAGFMISVLTGFESGVARASRVQERSRKNNQEFIDVTRQILKFFEQCGGRVTLHDGRLIFEFQDDLERYQNLFKQLLPIGEVAADILKERTDAMMLVERALREGRP